MEETVSLKSFKNSIVEVNQECCNKIGYFDIRNSHNSLSIKQEEDMKEVLENIEKSRQITEEDEKKFNHNYAKLYAKVLENVTNGKKIIRNCLDESISETTEDDNDIEYGIKVNFK